MKLMWDSRLSRRSIEVMEAIEGDDGKAEVGEEEAKVDGGGV